MRLGGPARWEPPATRRGEDQRSALLADERELVLAFHRAVPQLEPDGLELAQQLRRVADDSELRDADELGGGEGA